MFGLHLARTRVGEVVIALRRRIVARVRRDRNLLLVEVQTVSATDRQLVVEHLGAQLKPNCGPTLPFCGAVKFPPTRTLMPVYSAEPLPNSTTLRLFCFVYSGPK